MRQLAREYAATAFVTLSIPLIALMIWWTWVNAGLFGVVVVWLLCGVVLFDLLGRDSREFEHRSGSHPSQQLTSSQRAAEVIVDRFLLDEGFDVTDFGFDPVEQDLRDRMDAVVDAAVEKAMQQDFDEVFAGIVDHPSNQIVVDLSAYPKENDDA